MTLTHHRGPLPATLVESVHALADSAGAADGVAPLSEHVLLALRGGPSVEHVLAMGSDGTLTAYGQRALDGAAELVVAPDQRRQGRGTEALSALEGIGPDLRVWAHGDLHAAREFMAANGYSRVRELHKLSRPLTGRDEGSVTFPPGFRLRSFVPGLDEEGWLALNAAAFVDHPEQGRVTRADLDLLMEQPWFDADGLLLLETDDPDPVLAGSHWTKVDPGERAPGTDRRLVPAGEVYVVAVSPAFQGRGLAAPLTAAGLGHLARRGLRAVVLYVDGDNTAALHTYRRLGFRAMLVDGMYARPSH